MENIGALFGHSDFYNFDIVKERLKKALIDAIENMRITTFYLGGKGQFDLGCAKLIRELKKEYPHIKSYLILAYLNNNLDDYDKRKLEELYDGTIYPPIENTPPRYAYCKRNEWMVNEARFLIFYVDHLWGGAYNALKFANKKHKKYINLGTGKI